MSVSGVHLQSLEIAGRLAARLRLFRALAVQARERQETELTLGVSEVWEAKDEAVLREWESHAQALTGATPLPLPDLEPADLEGLEDFPCAG